MDVSETGLGLHTWEVHPIYLLVTGSDEKAEEVRDALQGDLEDGIILIPVDKIPANR